MFQFCFVQRNVFKIKYIYVCRKNVIQLETQLYEAILTIFGKNYFDEIRNFP